jgi:hypothetical protein
MVRRGAGSSNINHAMRTLRSPEVYPDAANMKGLEHAEHNSDYLDRKKSG